MHENNKDQRANTEAGNITVYESHNMVLQQTIFCKLHHYLTLTEKDVFNHLHLTSLVREYFTQLVIAAGGRLTALSKVLRQ